MHEHGSLPRARQDGLLEEAVGEELLLYHQNSHTAHCLSPIAACVWRHCDGERDVAELAEFAGVSDDLIAEALHELREKDLLDGGTVLMESTVPGVSRREAIGRIVGIGGATAGASLIVSAVAATPAMASSVEEIKKESGGKCNKPAAYNCCICKEADSYTTKNKTECETFCNENYGGYVSFTPKSTPF